METIKTKQSQVDNLLDRFNGLFEFWGIRYPTGANKGRHLYSDDISNEARLAYFEAFAPHCEVGMDNCKSVDNKTEVLPLLTKAKSAVESIKRLTTEPNSVRRYQPRYVNRPCPGGDPMKWDRQYEFELSELDDRDRPWTLAVPGRSVVRMSGENATFRTYTEAEQAGLECDDRVHVARLGAGQAVPI